MTYQYKVAIREGMHSLYVQVFNMMIITMGDDVLDTIQC